MMSNCSIERLLLTDRHTDQPMVAKAIGLWRLNHRLSPPVDDGEMALEFLKKAGIFCGVPTPGLISSDMNMPRKNKRANDGSITPWWSRQRHLTIACQSRALAFVMQPLILTVCGRRASTEEF